MKQVRMKFICLVLLFIHSVCITLAPSPPVINAVTAIDSTSVQVAWSIPTNVNGILIIYTIIYNTEGSGSITVSIPYNGQLVSNDSFDHTV